MNGVALLVNNGIIVIFFSLLFTYLYLKEYKVASHLVLIVCLFIDNSFAIFYIALFAYAIMKRKTDLLILTLILFSASMYLYGFDTGGKPKEYFIDTLGVYAIVFSPLLFLYFVYAMYRILIKEEKNLLWYISFFSLVVSLLLSLRHVKPPLRVPTKCIAAVDGGDNRIVNNLNLRFHENPVRKAPVFFVLPIQCLIDKNLSKPQPNNI